MTTRTLIEAIAREYGTPCLVVDLDVVERNIATLQATCERAGVANRPHVKTHKNSRLASMQIAAGAKGITCQKLGEAEIMSTAGIDDILMTYNLLGAEKIGRPRASAGDHQRDGHRGQRFCRRGLTGGRQSCGRALPVAIECDTGRKRAGG